MELTLNNIIKEADRWVNADRTTKDGLQRYFMCWYALHYKVPLKDPLLLEHTFEELAVLYYINRIAEDPEAFKKITDPNFKTEDEKYEEWLKEQMGDEYISEEDSIRQIEEYEKALAEKMKELPDDLSLDFGGLE